MPLAEASGAPYRGRPLGEVLLALQEQGVPLVFTSELVRPEMRVVDEPLARDPRLVLEEILAPHGLAAREGPGGILVIVARGDARDGVPIHGEVRAHRSGDHIPGAVVRIVEGEGVATADAGGSFSLAGLAPGRYTLEASAPGFLDERLEVQSATAGAQPPVVFLLRPLPFIHDEIVVRPSRLTLLHERPESSFSWGREEIASLPRLGDDLFRATSLLPGTAANDVTAQFSVHGGRRDEVRVLLDGQELYDAYHLKDYDNALSIVPATNLAGASLSTGAYPASQGDRMSGVLDLRTVDPEPGRHWVLGVSVLDALASSSGTFGEGRGGWLVTGRRGSIDLAAEAIGDEHPAFWDLFGKTDWETGLGPVSVHFLTARDELEVDKAEEEGFERLENNYRSTYGWARHRATLADRLLVESSGSWTGLRRDRGGTAREEEGGFELGDRRELDVLALEQAWSLGGPQGHLGRWGWEARRYDATFDYFKELELEIPVVAPFSRPRLVNHAFSDTLRGEHLGVWASDSFSLRDRLTAELGLRYDRHTATDDTLLSPRVNLGWRLGERSVVRAAWGRFFQSQRPYELQVEDGESALRRAELSEHWVLGYETLFASRPLGVEAVRLELFRRDIEDPRPRFENLLEPLNIFSEIEPDRVRIAPSRSVAQGAEVLVRGHRGRRFDWWLAYSYARARDHIGGDLVPRSLDQPHTVTLDLHTRLPREWNLNLAWRYHTGWPITPIAAQRVLAPEELEDDPDSDAPETPEGELAAVFGPHNSRRLQNYHRLDLRLSRRWDLRAGELTLFLDVQNLYDRRNLAGFDVALDEEAEAVVLEKEHWPGLFPSLGVTWRF